VTAPDIEVSAKMQAQRVVGYVLPKPQTSTAGQDVDLSCDETRNGLPTEMEMRRRYDDVQVEKRMRALVRRAA
jgi:hypothetical protein